VVAVRLPFELQLSIPIFRRDRESGRDAGRSESKDRVDVGTPTRDSERDAVSDRALELDARVEEVDVDITMKAVGARRTAVDRDDAADLISVIGRLVSRQILERLQEIRVEDRDKPSEVVEDGHLLAVEIDPRVVG
jgi:hypothetical protein